MNLHLIHVGKCAGESIRTGLAHHGLPVTEYHCRQSNKDLANAILNAGKQDYFIIPIRDPIDRFVSAFEWDLFEKILSKNGDGALDKWVALYDTFPTANSLAEALTSPDRNLRTEAENGLSESALHIQMDLAWYLPPLIADNLRKGNASAIRVENINKDFRLLMNRLGVHVAPNFTVPFSKDNYKSRIPKHRRTENLSELARRNVKLHSSRSYETMRILEERRILPNELSAK